MLAFVNEIVPKTKNIKQIMHAVDLSDNQWESRGNGELQCFLVNKMIELTSELKLYLLYFAQTQGHNTANTLKSFSNLPIKEE